MTGFALAADVAWVGGRFERGVLVEVEGDRIVAVRRADPLPAGAHRLPGRALLPAFVNAHSHAFQRILRGATENIPPGAGDDDFWSWRERMYRAATELDADAIAAVSLWAYVEMAKAGYGTVVEFHYLHHRPDGTPHDDPADLDLAVARAALQAGLRVTFLPVAYARAGAGRPAEPRQRRFLHPDPESFLRFTAAVEAALASEARARVGVAPHSTRAVPASWIATIGREALARGWPFHIHAAEQSGEIEAARAEYGLSPIGVIAAAGALGPQTTLVHAIHTGEEDLAAIASTGASVCACPTTEANLGDGVIPADQYLALDVRIALGTDSHARIDPFAEARALENHLRLIRRRRNVLVAPQAGLRSPAPFLFACATIHGARAAGWSDLGEIAPGSFADLTAVDLASPALAAPRSEADATLLSRLLFAATAADVTDTWVAGVHIVRDRVHPLEAEARAGFETSASRLP